MSDVEERILALINAQPLPGNAEEQLDTLLEELPEPDRSTEAALWHEALATARQAADFDPAAPTLELGL
ncbi:hypothetical protein [Sagittula salina]|uniref:Uncharacterized protein n=1 Tax=Sagittula salina TaxID=2820268 RepID=A0A940S4K0_9RHOB|nr:hypothetical protein [Sagittula salina]MBP0483950.1 hypothetical protein [Sagittula salina]